jgi:hypothetical protein
VEGSWIEWDFVGFMVPLKLTRANRYTTLQLLFTDYHSLHGVGSLEGC